MPTLVYDNISAFPTEFLRGIMCKTNFIQSFGRKRARGLSNTQKNDLLTLYKTYGLEISQEEIDPCHLFPNSYEKFFLEIGFGRGEHLTKNAELNQNIGFIGCEPFENGVVNALQDIREKNLQNVRIYNGDARILLEKLKPNSIARFYILFPDPWPKKRHHKRRILSKEFIENLQNKHTGELVVATDCRDYMLEIINHFKGLKITCSDDLELLSQKPDWFLETRYEQKALGQGLKCYYMKVHI